MPRPRWTVEQAREMGKRSAAVRAERKRNPPKSEPEPDPIALATLDATLDVFTLRRLARVRRQLERIDRMIEEENDPQRLDRLAAASMRLSDQEFALANRPKPGNRRPGPERSRPAVSQVPRPVPAPAPAPTVAPIPDCGVTPPSNSVPPAQPGLTGPQDQKT